LGDMILALRVSEGSEDRENDRSSLPRRGHFFQAKSWKKPRTYSRTGKRSVYRFVYRLPKMTPNWPGSKPLGLPFPNM
jgi:hypothetical protein